MGWDRRRRQDAMLKEKIAVIVQHRLHDPCMGFVTVTGVEVSRDRREATVKYTVLGDEAARRRTARALGRAAPYVQEQMAPTLRTRFLPVLRFVYDESIEREATMLTLLEELATERAEREGDEVPREDQDEGTDLVC